MTQVNAAVSDWPVSPESAVYAAQLHLFNLHPEIGLSTGAPVPFHGRQVNRIWIRRYRHFLNRADCLLPEISSTFSTTWSDAPTQRQSRHRQNKQNLFMMPPIVISGDKNTNKGKNKMVHEQKNFLQEPFSLLRQFQFIEYALYTSLILLFHRLGNTHFQSLSTQPALLRRPRQGIAWIGLLLQSSIIWWPWSDASE